MSLKVGNIVKLTRNSSEQKLNIHYKIWKIDPYYIYVEVVANPTKIRPIGWRKFFSTNDIDYFGIVMLYSNESNFKRGKYALICTRKRTY